MLRRREDFFFNKNMNLTHYIPKKLGDSFTVTNANFYGGGGWGAFCLPHLPLVVAIFLRPGQSVFFS